MKMMSYTGYSNYSCRNCRVVYYPPQSPDLCWEAVRTCPDTANSELKMLCERGSSNYINITRSKIVYRNQFCAMCHGEDLSFSEQAHLDLQSGAANMSWINNRLAESRSDNSDLSLLVAMQPKLHDKGSSINFAAFGWRDKVIKCSFFMKKSHDYCDEELVLHRWLPTQPIWDLGSLACFSQHHKVCDLFVVSDSSKAPECTEPGCGANMVLDPSSLECQWVSGYIKKTDVISQLDQRWHSDIICSYQSQCRAAELGLVKFEDLNCYCDKFCVYFNDCCEDSAFQATPNSKLEEETFKCYKDNSDLRASASEDLFFWGIMQIDRCPSQFEVDEIRKLCETGPDTNIWERVINFGLIHTPVTHTGTGLRYVGLFLICFQNSIR